MCEGPEADVLRGRVAMSEAIGSHFMAVGWRVFTRQAVLYSVFYYLHRVCNVRRLEKRGRWRAEPAGVVDVELRGAAASLL
jgi:hypothetical protein